MDNINLTVIIAQIINFLILFILFKKFVADKLNKTISEKRELTRKLENAEKEYKKTLEKAYLEKSNILKDARKNANKLFKEMEQLSKARELEILERAEKRADMIVEWGQRQIEKDRLEMIEWVKSYVLDLTLKLNSKLFKDEKVDRDFLKKEIKNLA